MVGKNITNNYEIFGFYGTEYTQNGNGRFLANILSRWKNFPRLVRGGGGSRPYPFTIFTITYKVAVSAPAERADPLTLFHLYPYVYSVDQFLPGIVLPVPIQIKYMV